MTKTYAYIKKKICLIIEYSQGTELLVIILFKPYGKEEAKPQGRQRVSCPTSHSPSNSGADAESRVSNSKSETSPPPYST